MILYPRARCAFAVISLFVPLAAIAQTPTGEIGGIVRDPTGRVVPNAAIRVRNQNTDARITAMTNDSGEYNIPLVRIGKYTVGTESSGFRAAERKDVPVGALQNVRVDFSLEIGETSQTITVAAETSLVDARGVVHGMAIDDRRINDLPLNGRNPLALTKLLPGVNNVTTTSGPQPNQQRVRVNGGRYTGLTMLLDGGSLSHVHRGSSLQLPPPDALQEFKAATVGTPAEYGRGSAVISAVTRSGTNELHGSAWEFFRNDAFDARSFFAASVSKLRYNQFGGTAGGPVYLPKLYDGRNRTFWFFSYQGLQIRRDKLVSSAIPATAAELLGDFSRVTGALNDPLTGQPFPGRQIPTSRFDSVSRTVMDRYNQPANRANGTYVQQLSTPTGGNTYLTRADHALGDRNRLSFRYLLDTSTLSDDFGNSNMPNYSPLGNQQRMQTATFEDTHTFSPVLLNVFRATYTRFNFLEFNTVRETLKDLGATDFVHAGGPATLPQIDLIGRMVLMPGVDRQRLSEVFDLAEFLTWSRGAHQFKFGVDVKRNRFLYRNNQAAGGVFRFDGTQSGDAVADFMLGRARTMTLASVFDSDQRTTTLGAFLQDTWKIRPRLTLNYGIRYEMYPTWDERFDRMSSFVPGATSQRFPKAPAGLVFVGDPAFTYKGDRNNFAPRIGIAWDVFGNGRTAVRSSFGVYFEPLTAEMPGGEQMPQPFGIAVTRDVLQFSAPFRGTSNPFPYSADANTAVFAFPVIVPKSFNPDVTTPYTMNYHFGVQHQFPAGFMADVSYVGNVSHKLPMLRELNIPRVTPNATAANTDARRIHAPLFGSVTQFYTDANANYNSLQMLLQRRLHRGFTLSTSYTWAKAIEENAAANFFAGLSFHNGQNPLDRRADRARGLSDIRHRWVSSVLYEVPLLLGRSWYGRALGHWEIGTILTMETGEPFTLTSGRDNSLSGSANDRPDVIGDWRMPEGRSRAEVINAYFNKAAFRANAAGTFGNAGRHIISGPGAINLDISLMKSVPIAETHRLQLRFDGFNIENRPIFNAPNTVFTSLNFGRITGAGAGRILQVSAKYVF